MTDPADDRIILQGMQFYGYHGRHPEEKALGQPFTVDLEAEVDLRAAGASDDIADTVSYTDLYRAVKCEMEGPPRHLLEAVAGAIALRALGFGGVAAVRVRVVKTRPPIKGSVVAGAGVEIYRRRPPAL